MSAPCRLTVRRDRGSALLAAMFLIVVVATLGIFAVRLQANQQQVGTLQLLQYRANAAAHAGLEYWSTRIASDPGIACSTVSINFDSYPGLRDFTVTAGCVAINAGTGNVYIVTADARSGAPFGSPDFVRRQLVRRVAPTSGVYD
jgi:MSHA biogenesis protein MshP